MRGNEFLDKMELINPTYIQAADATVPKKKTVWMRWGAIAACLGLIFAGAFGLRKSSQANTLQNWNSRYTANDYFKFCNTATGDVSSNTASLDSAAIPYEKSRYFSDMRKELESNTIIPSMDSHPLFTFAAHYNEDSSLYCVELLWSRRGIDDTEDYSDLKVIAGHQEIQMVDDCIYVEVDNEGNVLEPAVTITKRDGVQIVARGREHTEKTLTFQSDNGWYQIAGSWNDSYESVVKLFDWFWDNPIDFEKFPMDAGDAYRHTSLVQTPDAFREYLPDFSAFGFIEETTCISWKNDIPIRFEGHYVAHVSEELVKTQEYYDVEGHTKMHWCILAEPDVYDLAECLGDIKTLTEEQIAHALAKDDNRIKFMQNGLLIIVYPDDATEAWKLIESLM